MVQVKKADDSVGPAVAEAVSAMSNGEVLVLENVRFYKEETKNDPGYAEKLAANADLYVNDAFGTAHRAHASTEGAAHQSGSRCPSADCCASGSSSLARPAVTRPLTNISAAAAACWVAVQAVL